MENMRLLVRDDHRNDFTDCGCYSLTEAYSTLKVGNRLDTLFYGHCEPVTLSDFLLYVNSAKNWLYGLYDFDSGDLLCLCIVNNTFGRCAMLHFCFTTRSKGEEQLIAKKFFEIMQPHFSQFIGLTPKVYKHVVAFSRSMGADTSVILKEACYLGKKDKFVDGVLVRYNLGGNNG